MDIKLNELLNEQINHEFSSAYLYYAMSAYFSEISFDGFAKYMRKQAKEELEHAQKIYDYLILRGEKITFSRIEAPEINWVNASDVINSAYEHEKFITGKINNIFKHAKSVDDFATMNFLNWYIEEQLEEEEKFRNFKEKIKAFDECLCNLGNIDKELDKQD